MNADNEELGDEGTHDTVASPDTTSAQTEPPLPGDTIAPPGRARQALHSRPVYIVVVGTPSLMLWTLSSFADWHSVLVIPAVALTVVAVLLYLLRYWRGSQLAAEERQLHERHDYYQRAEAHPRAVAIEPSNRIGQRLEGPEFALWEFRLHPISLARLWMRHIFQTPVGLGVVAFYVIAIFLIFDGNLSEKFATPWLASAILVAAPLPYFAFTIAEWNANRYALTNQRFIAVLGLFRTQFGGIPRAVMMDQNDTTTVFGHFLAWLRIIDTPYGKLTFETPGPVRGNIPEVVPYVSHIAHNLAMYRPRPS